MLEGQVLHLFERRMQAVGMPVRIDLWNGRSFQFGDHPKIRIALRRPAALRALMPPGLGRFATAYVEGDIDLDADIHDIADFAAELCGGEQVDLDRHDSD
ncbi:MAG TPA: hypothetical protein VMT94_08725, partial [Burkholderiales bacterium]|nr:hypothetical protein [Burkholderiales bacterium]